MKKLFFALSLVAISFSIIAMDTVTENPKEKIEKKLLTCNSCYKKACNMAILAECMFASLATANKNWNSSSFFIKSKTCDFCKETKIFN